MGLILEWFTIAHHVHISTTTSALLVFHSCLKMCLFRCCFLWLHSSFVVLENIISLSDTLIVFITYLLLLHCWHQQHCGRVPQCLWSRLSWFLFLSLLITSVSFPTSIQHPTSIVDFFFFTWTVPWGQMYRSVSILQEQFKHFWEQMTSRRLSWVRWVLLQKDCESSACAAALESSTACDVNRSRRSRRGKAWTCSLLFSL